MSVRRGPTERDRSEGTPTQEGPNQEQAPLVTWGAFPSNSPKAKYLPLGRCLQTDIDALKDLVSPETGFRAKELSL